jgi:Fe2+ or Zn2+ uptake regulation protein
MTCCQQSALKGLKLKNTPRRRAVLECLANATTYVSPDEVWQALQGRFSRLGLPTVYRILEELAIGGLIDKVLHPNRQLYYFFCGNASHHHHFICLNCRRVEDVAFCGIDRVEEEVRKRIGGTVLSHIVQVNGLCHDCSSGQEGVPAC